MNYEVVDGMKNGARRAWDVTEGAAYDAKSTVESAAVGARSSFFDGLEKVTKVAAAVRAFGIADALARVGLQRRRSFFADLGVFGAGFVAGAAVTAIATPISGRAMRRQIGSFFGQLAAKGEDAVLPTVKHAGAQVSSIAHDVRDAASHKVDDVKQTAVHAKDSARDTLGQAKESIVSKVHDITESVDATKHKLEDGTSQLRPGNRN